LNLGLSDAVFVHNQRQAGTVKEVSVAVSVVLKSLRPVLDALDLIPPTIQHEGKWRAVRRPLVNYINDLEWLERHAHWEQRERPVGASTKKTAGSRQTSMDSRAEQQQPKLPRGLRGAASNPSTQSTNIGGFGAELFVSGSRASGVS
jgi:hypothetical protein